MIKLSPRTVLHILKLYQLVDKGATLKQLDNLKISSHQSHATAEVSVEQRHYGVLFASQLDDLDHQSLWSELPAETVPLPNPLDETTVVTPFLGKATMVLYLPTTKRRLDSYLATIFDPSLSRSQWQKHIKAGHIQLNGQVVTSPKTEVDEQDSLEVQLPEPPDSRPNIQLLYRDREVIVINKPAGLLTHAKGGIVHETTVADFIRPQTEADPDTDRPGIVHRLDRDTSGVMITARTKLAAKELRRQFAARTVKKTYLAIIHGQPQHQRAYIDLPIARHPAQPSTFRVDATGKPAQTQYQIIAQNQQYSLVRLHPTTGRTHQLRVHLAYLGTPIVGDRIYGPEEQPEVDQRLLLHAHKLEVTLPSGRRHDFTAPVPDEFLSFFPGIDL